MNFDFITKRKGTSLDNLHLSQGHFLATDNLQTLKQKCLVDNLRQRNANLFSIAFLVSCGVHWRDTVARATKRMGSVWI